ncbi:hypothetical protein VIGAN_02201200 [Vigna angularis var. angularis]|uniref:Uncharacterized protein n=1 Tax=Vigna angularis var. angularis TaxID=157739 RepID=A0A0S3RFB5_PHAAN|nr:hypothetical protein VIGAN_02201200 [Vigna angularis var. angularis]
MRGFGPADAHGPGFIFRGAGWKKKGGWRGDTRPRGSQPPPSRNLNLERLFEEHMSAQQHVVAKVEAAVTGFDSHVQGKHPTTKLVQQLLKKQQQHVRDPAQQLGGTSSRCVWREWEVHEGLHYIPAASIIPAQQHTEESTSRPPLVLFFMHQCTRPTRNSPQMRGFGPADAHGPGFIFRGAGWKKKGGWRGDTRPRGSQPPPSRNLNLERLFEEHMMTNERSSTSERTLVHQRTNARRPLTAGRPFVPHWTTVRSVVDERSFADGRAFVRWWTSVRSSSQHPLINFFNAVQPT